MTRPPTIVRTDTLTKVDAAANNNKLWRITLYSDSRITTEWGRIGQSLQSKSKPFPPDRANGEYERQLAAKLRGGYNRVQLEQPSEQGIDLSQLPPAIRHQFNQITQLAEPIERHSLVRWNPIKGHFTSPIALVGRNTCLRARQILQRLETAGSLFDALVESYLQLIPLEVGRQVNPRALLGSSEQVRLQLQVIDSIERCYGVVDAIKAQVRQALQEQQSWIDQSRAVWVDWGDDSSSTAGTACLTEVGPIGRAPNMEW